MQIVDEAEVEACRVEPRWKVRTVMAFSGYCRYLYPHPEKSIMPCAISPGHSSVHSNLVFLVRNGNRERKEKKKKITDHNSRAFRGRNFFIPPGFPGGVVNQRGFATYKRRKILHSE